MMVADTSAIVAILMDEPERQSFSNAMVNDGASWFLVPLVLNS